MKCDKPEPDQYWTDELKICHFDCRNCGREVVEVKDGVWKHGHFTKVFVEDN